MSSDSETMANPEPEALSGSSDGSIHLHKRLCVSLVQWGSSANENKAQMSKRTIDKQNKRKRKLGKKPLTSNNQPAKLQVESQGEVFGDDDDGYLSFNYGDVIDSYYLMGFLGRGSFGKVAKARHSKTSQIVALKISRNTPECRESAHDEIAILKKLREIDPEGKNLWIEMLDHFEFQGHICLAFEKLGDSLYSFLRVNKFQPFQINQIRHIAYQLCYSIKALHDNSIVHTDLKPENILLESSDFTYGVRPTRQQTYRKPISSNIRVIDFGSAAYLHDDDLYCIQTRHYRAPEVIFDLKWTTAIDVWSIGCILFELYTGFCLFLVDGDYNHYILMREILGPLPDMYQFTSLGRKLGRVANIERKKSVRCKPLKKYMVSSAKEHQELFDLLEKMLNYDPAERLTLSEAMKHSFFLLLSDDEKLE